MGKDGYPGNQHDPARGKQILPVAQRQNRPVLPPADGSGMGIRLPAPARRPRISSGTTPASSANTPGSSRTAISSIRRSARKSPIRGAFTTCAATWWNGCWTNTTRITINNAPARAKSPIRGTRRPSPIRIRCAAARGTTRRRRAAAPPAAAPTAPGKCRTRSCPRASGISPTRNLSASASCARSRSRRRSDAEVLDERRGKRLDWQARVNFQPHRSIKAITQAV